MNIDGPMNTLACAIGDHPLMQRMLLESAAKNRGKKVEELTVFEMYGGSVKLSDFLDRLNAEGTK